MALVKQAKMLTGLALTVSLPSYGNAQTTMFEGFLSSPGTGMLDTIVRNRTVWEPLGKDRPQSNPDQPRTGPRFLGPPLKKPPNLAILRFVPDAALRRTIASEFADRLTQGKAASPLGRFLIGGEAIGGMHRRMTSAGLSSANVSDSFAFFIASQWSMARGNAAPPPRPVLLSFSKQVAGMLAEQPAAAQMSNKSKQRQSDSAMLLNAIMLRGMAEAEGDPEATAEIAASATQMLKGMGFDPDKFNLTAQGLVPVKWEE